MPFRYNPFTSQLVPVSDTPDNPNSPLSEIVVSTISELRLLTLSGRPINNDYAVDLIRLLPISATSFSGTASNAYNFSYQPYVSTDGSLSQHITFDLSTSCELVQLTLQSVTNGLTNCVIEASADLAFTSSILISTLTASTAASITLELSNITARYLRIRKAVADINPINLNELELLGKAVAAVMTPGSVQVVPPVLFAFKRVTVLGYYTPNDGGGGEFVLHIDDTVSPDDGGIIIVASNGDRYKRFIKSDEPISVLWYGADRYGTTTFDNAPIFNAAIRAARDLNTPKVFVLKDKVFDAPDSAAGRIVIPEGVYTVRSSIVLPPGGASRLELIGTGKTVLIYRALTTQLESARVKLFDFKNYRASLIKGLVIQIAAPLFAVFHFASGDTAGVVPTNIRLHDILVERTGGNTYYDGKTAHFGVAFIPWFSERGDTNNDLCELIRVRIRNVNVGFFFIGYNCHNNYLQDCGMSSCNWGLIAQTGANFKWIQGGTGGNKYADFYVENVSKPCRITGHNAEHSERLIELWDMGAPVLIENVRWAGGADNEYGGAVINVGNAKHPVVVSGCLFESNNGGVIASNRLLIPNNQDDVNLTHSYLNNVQVKACQWRHQSLPQDASLNENVFGAYILEFTRANVDFSTSIITLDIPHRFAKNQGITFSGKSLGNGSSRFTNLNSNKVYFAEPIPGAGNETRFQLLASYNGAPVLLTDDNGSEPIYIRIATYRIHPLLGTGSPDDLANNQLFGMEVVAEQSYAYSSNAILPNEVTSSVVEIRGVNGSHLLTNSGRHSNLELTISNTSDAYEIGKIYDFNNCDLTISYITDGRLHAVQYSFFLDTSNEFNVENLLYKLEPLQNSYGLVPPFDVYLKFFSLKRTISAGGGVTLVGRLFVSSSQVITLYIKVAALSHDSSLSGLQAFAPKKLSKTLVSSSLVLKTVSPLILSQNKYLPKVVSLMPVEINTTTASPLTLDFSISETFYITPTSNLVINNPKGVLEGIEYRIIIKGGHAHQVKLASRFMVQSGQSFNVLNNASVDYLIDCVGTLQGGLLCSIKEHLAPVLLNNETFYLERRSFGDDEGLFYWKGSASYTSTWANPYSSNLTLTLLVNGANVTPSANIANLFDRTSSTFYEYNDTVNTKQIVFDLQANTRFKLEEYTMRCRETTLSNIPLTWQVHGSINNLAWDLIHERKADDNQVIWSKAGQWVGFKVNNNQLYRYYRLTIPAPYRLSFAEIEFYGVAELTTP